MTDRKRDDGFLVYWKSILACLLVGMCQFQYGLDSTLIGGIQAMTGFLEVFGYRDPASPIGYNISTLRQQLISSLMILGAFLSSMSAGLIAKYIGRKFTLWIACLLCLIADIIMMTTTSIGVLYFGRLLMGLSNGLFNTFGQLYIQECAPSKYRGVMIGAATYWIIFGALIGTIVDNFTVPFGGKKSYLVPLGIALIMPGIIAVGLLFLPESPRWFLQTNNEEKARSALERLAPYPELVDGDLASMKLAIDNEAALARSTEIVDLWRSPVDRRRALLAIGAIVLQPASGASYIIIYSTYFFEMADIGKPFQNSCIMSGVGAVVLILNSLIITRWGYRRIFLTWGLILCGLTQVIMAAVYTAHPGTILTGKVIVGCTILNVTFYNGMVATYALLCGGEFPSQRFRSYTLGIATAMGYFFGWLVAFTAPYFINPSSLNWGPKYGYIWAGSCLIAAIWTWIFLPEVKGRTFEEIDEMFEARLPPRKFRAYKCTGPAALGAAGDGPEIEHALRNAESTPGDSKHGVTVFGNHVEEKI
ncbi:MFS transporter [Mollisia scopiformis]|uniref:MFS transporter n=1 Tax=Mollisia scopiformis TaxID=149040 RepID=A0A132B5A8_MOLSC|nr:MFS transporter [Mollisia scopiformis]KUJ07595.1 MFS transporter [Mollisia scopiformis]